VEQLSSELKQLKLQSKIDKLKKKLKDSKSREVTSSSSSNEEINASFEEEGKGKRGRKGDKRSYNTTSFNYNNLPHSSAFTSVPISKAPRFYGTDYTK
jgi:flagellar hook assembly protein FlgD